MTESLAEFTGKLIDVGNLDAGRGVMLEVNGEEVYLTGLTIAETKGAAKYLGERLTVTIRRADSIGEKHGE